MRRPVLPLTTTYDLPSGATGGLDALVNRIAANPGAFIAPHEVEGFAQNLTLRLTLDRLPLGMSEADLVGTLKLAMLTEAATDTYAEAIDTRAARYGTPWLGRFIRDVWVPDEKLHHTPYRAMLLAAGVSEAEINAEIERTCARALDYRSGDTPMHLTTYGMLQEYVTDNWHGLIARLLRPTAPAAARIAARVKQRETLHTLWYRDMTALQLEANPRLLRHIAEALGHFEMPGKSLVPELEVSVPRWLQLLENDFAQWTKDLARLLFAIVGDTRKAGQLLIQIAGERGSRIGPVSPSLVRATLDRLGGPGYGLLGEAMLERLGLGYLYRDRRPTSSGGSPSRASRLRGMLRRWLAEQLDFGIIPESPAAAPVHA